MGSNFNAGRLGRLIKILNKEKNRILNKQDSGLSEYCLDKNELFDPLDEANVNLQASQELRFRNRENIYLKKINKSLQLVKDGSYGLCEGCDGEILFERLLARPTAELCICCKEEEEFSEGHNFHQKKSKSLGQTMNDMH